MAGTDPALIVRVGANLDDLKAGLTTADGAVKSFATTVTDTLGSKMPAGLEHLADATHAATDSMGLLEGMATGFVTGLSAEAVLSFAASLVTLGDRLSMLHDRTDLSIGELQRLSLVAATSGTTLETLAHASFVLGKNLAEGKQSTIEALKDLGFTLREMTAMNPDARIEALAAAFAKVDDPLRRDKDGIALLGRTYEEVIPALKAMTEETGKHVRMSDEEVDMLAKLSNWFSNLKASIAPVIVQWIDGALHATTFYHILQDIGAIAIKLPTITGEAADGVRAWNEANKQWIATTKAKAPTMEAAFELDRQFIRNEKEKADALKEEQEGAAELMKLWEEYFKAYDAVRALSFEHTKQIAKDSQALIDAQKKAVNEAVQAELQATAQLNAAYGLTASGGVKTVTTAYEAYLEKLHQLSLAKVEGISQTNQETLALKDYTDTLYADAVALDTVTDAQAAAIPVTEAATDSFTLQGGTLRLNIATLEEYNRAIHDFYDQFVGNAGSVGNVAGPAGWNMPRMLGMASGGPVTASTPYVVGERGPEVFVPTSSGTIVPNSTSSVTNIYITQPLGTPQAIAAAVGAAQLGALQNRGERFRPSGV